MYDRARYLQLIGHRTHKYHRPQPQLRERLDLILDRRIALTESISDITNKLTDIPYVIIGGHAINLHGHNRTTLDLDLLVNPDHMEAAFTVLAAGSHTELAIPRPDRPIVGMSCQVGDTSVDLIWIDQPWADEALTHALSTPHGMVISKPYLIMTKLWAGRGEQDDTDVISLLRSMTSADLRLTRKMVSKYLKADIDDYDQMVLIAKS